MRGRGAGPPVIARLITAMIIILLAPAAADPSETDQPAVITGSVIDAQTGTAIPLANVYLEGTMLGDATDGQGRFEIAGLEPGSYRLTTAVVGYTPLTREITLSSGELRTLDMALAPTAIEVAPVVVTASRRSQDLLDAPVSLAVVTSGDIAKRHVMSPDEVLNHVPGVTVTATQVNIRGSSGFSRGAGSRILLLVDGVPALAGDTGNTKWDLVPAEQIEGIEIVKSAASAVYGSSALGGVVNMVTRRIPESPETRFRVSGGYYDDPHYPQWKWTTEWLTYHGFDISHSRRIGRLGLLAALSRKSSDGYRRNSDFDRMEFVAKATWSRTTRQTFTLFTTWAFDEYGHATEWQSQKHALDTDPAAWHDRVRSDKIAGYLRLRNTLSPRTLVSATLNWYRTDWDNDFHDTDDGARGLKVGGSLQVDRILKPWLQVTFGAEGWRTGVASTIFADRNIAEVGCFAEGEVPFGEGLKLTLGTRYDTHRLSEARGWEGLLSPRAGIVLRTSSGSSLRISAGRGFRAPTIAEMFSSTTVGGFTVKPNLNLSPERGNTYEIGWLGDLGPRLRIGAGLFRSDYRQLIEPGIDPEDGRIHFTNIRDARVSGVDTWVQAVPVGDHLALGLAYMYLDTEDRATGDPLAYRSRHDVKASVDVSGPRYSIGLDHIYRSRVTRVEVYADDERVPIRVTDLRGEVSLGTLRVWGKVSNLFQYNYTEIERSLAPIRHFTFAVSGTL
jgi:iron complex outermembrane receptor protein